MTPEQLKKVVEDAERWIATWPRWKQVAAAEILKGSPTNITPRKVVDNSQMTTRISWEQREDESLPAGWLLVSWDDMDGVLEAEMYDHSESAWGYGDTYSEALSDLLHAIKYL